VSAPAARDQLDAPAPAAASSTQWPGPILAMSSKISIAGPSQARKSGAVVACAGGGLPLLAGGPLYLIGSKAFAAVVVVMAISLNGGLLSMVRAASHSRPDELGRALLAGKQVRPQWASDGPPFTMYYPSRRQAPPGLRQLINRIREVDGLTRVAGAGD
jgi:DNA-binding transcriptional LysR family regulator